MYIPYSQGSRSKEFDERHHGDRGSALLPPPALEAFGTLSMVQLRFQTSAGNQHAKGGATFAQLVSNTILTEVHGIIAKLHKQIANDEPTQSTHRQKRRKIDRMAAGAPLTHQTSTGDACQPIAIDEQLHTQRRGSSLLAINPYLPMVEYQRLPGLALMAEMKRFISSGAPHFWDAIAKEDHPQKACVAVPSIRLFSAGASGFIAGIQHH
ncbi:hypothetical protein PG994_015224 [Apiospora phragmitis]|uniref:Uncharacterized protein n=1 Tax=Apiospora phragmitis TaxID=2905665 RepID=A0ABR1SRA6_9PEZI